MIGPEASPMRSPWLIVLLLLGLGASLLPAAAHAQTDNYGPYIAAHNQGVDAMDRSQYQNAIEHFRRALAVDAG
jgi:Flp pilus assembly protein TadD